MTEQITDKELAEIKAAWKQVRAWGMGAAIADPSVADDVLRLVAEVERLQLIFSQVCSYCGGRIDFDSDHIERCRCLPVIRQNITEIERLRLVVKQAWDEREQLLNKAADRHTELQAEIEQLKSELSAEQAVNRQREQQIDMLALNYTADEKKYKVEIERLRLAKSDLIQATENLRAEISKLRVELLPRGGKQ